MVTDNRALIRCYFTSVSSIKNFADITKVSKLSGSVDVDSGTASTRRVSTFTCRCHKQQSLLSEFKRIHTGDDHAMDIYF